MIGHCAGQFPSPGQMSARMTIGVQGRYLSAGSAGAIPQVQQIAPPWRGEG